MLRRFAPDPFVAWLLVVAAAALLLPVRGSLSALVDALTFAAIFALFFLHGARLPREALVAGLSGWRLHLAILACIFLLFPSIGLGLSLLFPGLLPPPLWTGILFLCVLPSTVQSAIAYTSMARGDVAGAVAAAAFSNLIGVFLTPLLVSLLIDAQTAEFSVAGVGKVVLLLVFPFALGHALRPHLATRLSARPKLTTTVDRGTILLAVYGAFSAATVEGLWTRIPPLQLVVVAGLCLLILAMVLAGCWTAGRLGGFPPHQRATILFCGSVKSLASGVPMARILFPGPAAGPAILPIMLFHSLQLIACAWIAARMGAQDREA